MTTSLLILGATGFIGRRLVARLQSSGAQITALVRNQEEATKILGPQVALIDDLHDWPEGPLDAVINLAGAPIADKSWTEARKTVLRGSRVGLTQRLVEVIKEQETKPKALIQGSAIGFYPFEDDDQGMSESSAPGGGYLAKLCQAWEAEALAAQDLGLRVCLARTGLVLESSGGALAKMLPPFKFGLGGPLGTGRQWMSWIHLEDHVSALIRLVSDPELSGPFNLCAPYPVRNQEFTRALGRALGRSTPFRVPSWGLKIALGERAQLLLGSQKVLPRRLEEAGFVFKYPRLEEAFNHIF
ncbi:MAG: TIGR01777 family oxidoreductase [bacterium]|nr:TIGR01777 family oxidoreductase [bacterium]